MQVSIFPLAVAPSQIDIVMNGGAKHSPDIKSPTRRSYHSRSSSGAGGKKHKKHWSSKRKLGKSFRFRRSELNTLPIEHEFTPEMKRVIKRYQSDKSKRGRFIWKYIEDNIHSIQDIRELNFWVEDASDLVAKIKQFESDKSKWGRFIWKTIKDDIPNITSMKDLASFVKRGSNLYYKLYPMHKCKVTF